MSKDQIIKNMAKTIKFMSTNPDLTEEDIIEMFSKEENQDYFDRLNKGVL